MKDQFMEEATVKQNRALETVLYLIVCLMMVVSIVLAMLTFTFFNAALQGGGSTGEILMWIGICIVSIAFAIYAWFNKDKVRTEYEYTITNAQMDFAAVYNNAKRKNLGTMNLKNIAACGDVASGSFQRYISMPGVKRSNWFVNREADLFYIYFQKEEKKQIIIIEPSNEMKTMIKRVLVPGTFQVN